MLLLFYAIPLAILFLAIVVGLALFGLASWGTALIALGVLIAVIVIIAIALAVYPT